MRLRTPDQVMAAAVDAGMLGHKSLSRPRNWLAPRSMVGSVVVGRLSEMRSALQAAADLPEGDDALPAERVAAIEAQRVR